jgi:FtsH-binding integral membrane protein
MKRNKRIHSATEENSSSSNLLSLSNEVTSIGSVDGNYIGKFHLLLRASKFAPEEEEVSFLLKHILKVYFIFMLQLGYTGAVVWYMYLHPDILLKLLNVFFAVHGLVFIVGSLSLIFLLWIAQGINSLILGLVAITSFTTVTGIMLGLVPMVYDKNLIFEAFVLTIIIFVSSSFFGILTKNNLTGWGMPLFGGLLAIIVLGFFQYYYQNSLLNMLILLADIVVFTLYVAYDNQMIKIRFLDKLRDDIPDSNRSWWLLAMSSSIDIYLDFVNLFLDILSLLGDDDD